MVGRDLLVGAIVRVGLIPGLGIVGAGATWGPLSLPALRGWYDATVGFIAGISWADQSGIGNHLAAPGTVLSATVDGHPSIHIGDPGQNVQQTSFSLGAAGAISIFCVARLLVTGSYPALLRYSDLSFDDRAFNNDSVASKVMLHNAITNVTGTTTILNSWKRIGLTDLAGGTEKLYVGGTLEAAQANIGAIADGLLFYGGPAVCEVAEIVVTADEISAQNLALLDAYWAAKFPSST